MRPEDFRLVCIYDEEAKVWCVQVEKDPFRSIIVQVDKLEDAPKELGKCFEAMFTIGFKKEIHIKQIYESKT